jgi:hypothetical protein
MWRVGAIAVEIFDLLAWFMEHNIKSQLTIPIPIQLHIKEGRGGNPPFQCSYCVAYDIIFFVQPPETDCELQSIISRADMVNLILEVREPFNNFRFWAAAVKDYYPIISVDFNKCCFSKR